MENVTECWLMWPAGFVALWILSPESLNTLETSIANAEKKEVDATDKITVYDEF